MVDLSAFAVDSEFVAMTSEVTSPQKVMGYEPRKTPRVDGAFTVARNIPHDNRNSFLSSLKVLICRSTYSCIRCLRERTRLPRPWVPARCAQGFRTEDNGHRLATYRSS